VQGSGGERFRFAVKCVIREIRQRKDPQRDHFAIGSWRKVLDKKAFDQEFRCRLKAIMS